MLFLQKEFAKSSPVLDADLDRKRRRQSKCKLLASADNKGIVRIHNYPALKEHAHHYYSGHSMQVSAIQWTADDQCLVSVGGADRAVFQWRLQSTPTDHIRNYKPLKSTNRFKN